MIDIVSAAAIATDMKVLISAGVPAAPMGGATAGTYETAFRVRAKRPETLAEIKQTMEGYTGVDVDARNTPVESAVCAAGRVFLTQFSAGAKGMEAKFSVSTPWTEVVLVPAREAHWVPRSGTPYRVRLVRPIGKGRTQIWLVSPVDPAGDEQRKKASYGLYVADHLCREIGQDMAAEATEALRTFVATLDLPTIPRRPATSTRPEEAVWGDWVGTPTHMPNGQFAGRRIAHWGDQTGEYDVVLHTEKLVLKYLSPDGGRRQDEIWTETLVSSTHVGGSDVITAAASALSTAQRAWEVEGAAESAAHYAATEATNKAVATIQMPPLPPGRIDTSFLLWRMVYDRIRETR